MGTPPHSREPPQHPHPPQRDPAPSYWDGLEQVGVSQSPPPCSPLPLGEAKRGENAGGERGCHPPNVPKGQLGPAATQPEGGGSPRWVFLGPGPPHHRVGAQPRGSLCPQTLGTPKTVPRSTERGRVRPQCPPPLWHHGTVPPPPNPRGQPEGTRGEHPKSFPNSSNFPSGHNTPQTHLPGDWEPGGRRFGVSPRFMADHTFFWGAASSASPHYGVGI